MPSAALHCTHLSPVNPNSTACRKPPMPVKKFTAPDLSAFSVHTCKSKAVQPQEGHSPSSGHCPCSQKGPRSGENCHSCDPAVNPQAGLPLPPPWGPSGRQAWSGCGLRLGPGWP